LAQDRLLSTRKEFSVSSWLNAARSLGTTEEEKRLYEWNASALITVWGDSIAANQGGLHDYSHREWSGLLKDLYYALESLL
jgi:alpha-N-acetylglucosaminidase